MKVCPTCGEVYSDHAQVCRVHNIPLRDWSELTDSHPGMHTDVENRIVQPDTPFDVAAAAGEIDISTGQSRVVSSNATATPRSVSRVEISRSRAPRDGRVLGGRYRLDKQIGVGGYGAVFGGHDELTGTRVAVKVLSPAAAQSPELLTRFHREAIAASRVQHRHIVDVIDFDVDDDGNQFIVMEYLDGGDLYELLRNTPVLEPALALSIAAQCASGLAAAHAVGILHRDLKPSNVFLVSHEWRDDFVKIIDFGISKLTHAAGNYTDLTSASKVVGTPCYMSPEQARGERLDGRCDVYGLGVILFEMLTGERPFTGQSTLDILTKHLEAPRVPPSELRPELAGVAGLDELVLTALSTRRKHRYESMEEFSDAIVECLQLLDPSRADRLFELSGDVTPAAVVALTGDTELHVARIGPGAGRGMQRAGMLVALVAAAVVALVLWTRRSGDAHDSVPSPAKVAAGPGDALPPLAVGAAAPSGATLADAGGTPTHAPQPRPTPVASPHPTRDASPRPQRVLHRVHVTSQPSGAHVVRDGQTLGTTPLEVEIEPSLDAVSVVLSAPGHRKRRARVARDRTALHVKMTRIRYREPRNSTKPGVGIKEW